MLLCIAGAESLKESLCSGCIVAFSPVGGMTGFTSSDVVVFALLEDDCVDAFGCDVVGA